MKLAEPATFLADMHHDTGYHGMVRRALKKFPCGYTDPKVLLS